MNLTTGTDMFDGCKNQSISWDNLITHPKRKPEDFGDLQNEYSYLPIPGY